MSVSVDPTGRRSVSVEVEVSGSLEAVWEAIATGTGISSWFVPTIVDTGADGVPTEFTLDFGAGMVSAATITRWNPPRVFSAESEDFVPGGPTVATDWTIEPQDDGNCTVRVEHSLYANSDEYDGYLEATEAGWTPFFRTLQMYMAHFSGQPCSILEVMGSTPDKDSGWGELTESLGLVSVTAGDRIASLENAPRLAGVVARAHSESEFSLRLDEPCPGVGHLFAMPTGGPVLLSVRLYLYGEGAAAVVERERPVWESWMGERFPLEPSDSEE